MSSATAASRPDAPRRRPGRGRPALRDVVHATALLLGVAVLVGCAATGSSTGAAADVAAPSGVAGSTSPTPTGPDAVTSTSGSAPTAAPTGPAPTPESTGPGSPSEAPDPVPTAGTPIRMVVGDTVVTGRLADTAVARDLRQRLPLTLTVTDFNGVEKTAALDRPLNLDGEPRGTDPGIADIGYYAPDQVLVLYYGDVGFHNGIVALGQFDPAAVGPVEGLPDGTTVVLEAAGE